MSESASAKTPARARAFTLIEVLVVLIIIAIITAVSVLVFGQFGRGRREKMIVQQFARTIRVAQQQAILTPVVLGLGVSATGYQFYQYELPQVAPATTSEWHPLQNDALSKPRAFKSVFHTTVKSIATYAGVPNGHDVNPAILFLPSGYVTPFVIELSGDKRSFTITVTNNGTVTTHET